MIDLFKVRESQRNDEICAFIQNGKIHIGDTTCVVSLGKVKTKEEFEEWEDNKIQEFIKGE